MEHLIAGHSKNTLGRFIDLDDIQVLVERNDAIGQRLEDAFIIVLQREDIGKQLRVLNRDGNLGAERLCPADVDRSEGAAALVEHLNDPEALARLVGDRDRQNVAGAITGGAVDLAIEARIGIGVRHHQHLAVGERRAGDPGPRRDADFRLPGAFGDLRPQLVPGPVVEE